ncbi:HOOK-domain-containing protein [Cylindrobasidium torrendii FP15055 ss-10]|uniref:HOOK-domain-containing protein n=1 Tax=Cylindrobasidium torrendii FP15055 ss-10 TaxID=1314674 RepID=A0A0D7BCM1_9AGAR|nr:HOOK-domain-containing protein [Cylindrobasidium torrendii FP15055 ss-10]
MTDFTNAELELDAFYHFFETFTLTRPVTSVADLSDGSPLFEILSHVDEEYFRHSKPTLEPSDNWVLRFGSLKRLYRLMTQYFSDILQKATNSLEVPNLSAMAKDSDIQAILIMCRLTIAIGVQCERNHEFVGKIQGLSERDQHNLMRAIEQQVMSRIVASSFEPSEASVAEDDNYYRLQFERSQLLSEKEDATGKYETLKEENTRLQNALDELKQEMQDKVREVHHEYASQQSESEGRMETALKGEIDRLRAEVSKYEDVISHAEVEIEKLNSTVAQLTEKLDESQSKAELADKLKDQLDEYRHAADRLQKTENVMEKYKKKLQEGSELRQQLKSLERQNADLVDKNASLEEEYRKVAAFKPLMESYKTQVAELESKLSQRQQQIDTVKFDLEQAQTKARIQAAEREKDQETLDLYQERVRELELSSHRPVRSERPARQDTSEELPEPEALSTSIEEDAEAEGETPVLGLGGELDDAITGTTMTDLKLQVRRLKRELEAVKKNETDASQLLVMENLLEDATRMKTRYENDYLTAHREKLVLQRDLEEIRSGKSMGDGAEAAIALRQRLNETVEKLDEVQKNYAELSVKYDTQAKELTIAKSDLTLVNKDQLDILSTLRESVNEDKAGLETDIERLTAQNKELHDKNRMQLEQVNALLLEKINLQSEGIGQRERMLQRERDFGDLRASLNGKPVPEDVKAQMLAMAEELANLRDAHKAGQEKLQKAKQFIKTQDKLFKEEHAAKGPMMAAGNFEEAETSFRQQIKLLEDELARQKHLVNQLTHRYQKEQEMMMASIHAMGLTQARSHLGGHPSRKESISWLGKTRERVR